MYKYNIRNPGLEFLENLTQLSLYTGPPDYTVVCRIDSGHGSSLCTLAAVYGNSTEQA
jgi:hypothetical protein